MITATSRSDISISLYFHLWRSRTKAWPFLSLLDVVNLLPFDRAVCLSIHPKVRRLTNSSLALYVYAGMYSSLYRLVLQLRLFFTPRAWRLADPFLSGAKESVCFYSRREEISLPSVPSLPCSASSACRTEDTSVIVSIYICVHVSSETNADSSVPFFSFSSAPGNSCLR